MQNHVSNKSLEGFSILLKVSSFDSKLWNPLSSLQGHGPTEHVWQCIQNSSAAAHWLTMQGSPYTNMCPKTIQRSIHSQQQGLSQYSRNGKTDCLGLSPSHSNESGSLGHKIKTQDATTQGPTLWKTFIGQQLLHQVRVNLHPQAWSRCAYMWVAKRH